MAPRLAAVLLLAAACGQATREEGETRRVDELVARVRASGGPSGVVSLEDFFDGNDNDGSIAPNLLDHPGVARIASVLRAIRDRPDVYDVRVGVELDWDESPYPEGEWPFATGVYVVTQATAAEVDRWVAGIDADPSGDGAPEYPGPVPDGYRVVVVWWD